MSVIEFAKAELDRINFGEEDTRVMIEIMEKFFEQWDSGGAVWAVFPILMRLLACLPLTPLTGADDEWMDVGIGSAGVTVLQNRRCPTVFKESGEAYDIGPGPRTPVTFPYMPGERPPPDPVVEL